MTSSSPAKRPIIMSSSSRSERILSDRNTIRYWIWTWLPVALGIAMITVESTRTFGANHTVHWLQRLYEALFGPVTAACIDELNHILRKTGHFFGYGLIGLAWLRAWWFTLPRSRFFTDFVLAMLGTAAIASCDEWHQSFLPNRGSSPWDVLLDCTGALTLQLIVYIYVRIARPKQLARASQSPGYDLR